MNPQYLQNQVNRLERELADFQKKIAEESKKEFEKSKKIDGINRSITQSTTASTIQNKQRQIQGLQKEILSTKQKTADLQKKIAEKTTELGRKKDSLRQAEQAELKKSRQQQLEFQKSLQIDIETHKEQLDFLVSRTFSSPENEKADEVSDKEFDFFISHASEDKDDFVRELATTLINENFKVWYDEFELKVGDSLRKMIDNGLSKSRYGIVIISQYFINKNWPEYELNGMVAREMNGHKVVLPIWHKVSKNEVLEFSPSLADKLALNTAIHTVDDIVKQLKAL